MYNRNDTRKDELNLRPREHVNDDDDDVVRLP